MNKEIVKETLASCRSEEEWNNACDHIKKVHNGYPDFWFREIIQSGFMQSIVSKFGRDDKIRIIGIDSKLDTPKFS